MSLVDILSQVLKGGQVQDHHVDQVAQHAPTDLFGQGIADAFGSKETPPIGNMVGQMFGASNGNQQAGMLNSLISTLGPAAFAALAGGVLGKIMQPGQTQVTPEQAAKLSPLQVQEAVNHAHETNPSVVDKMGSFYAEHPGLVKTLGGAALLIALSKMKDNLGNRE